MDLLSILRGLGDHARLLLILCNRKIAIALENAILRIVIKCNNQG